MVAISIALPAIDSRADEPTATPRVAIPDAAAQANAMKNVRDLFGQQIDNAKSPFGKTELAKKLLQQGVESKSDPAAQFVLFNLARDMAASAGDSSIALQAIDESARVFRLDTIPLREQAIAAIEKTATNPQASRILADAAWLALDDAVAAENFTIGKRLAAEGLAAAKRAKDIDLLRQWTARAKQFDEISSAFDAVEPALDTLRKKPLDASANQAFGNYLVMAKGDWDHGLPMLALANASEIQALAVAEMSPPDDAPAQLKLADGWWHLADESTDAFGKERLEGRAMYWYGRALPNLSGVDKSRVLKRFLESTGRVFARVQAAMRAKKAAFTQPVPTIPPRGSNRVRTFADAADEGGLLIGFEFGLGKGDDGNSYIRAIRPIFLTPRGETQGTMHGAPTGDTVSIRAPMGFAVGGMSVKAPGRTIEGISVVFMQIQGAGLDPRIEYNSPWFGNRTSAIATRIGGSGVPAVGIVGRADNSALLELALACLRGS